MSSPGVAGHGNIALLEHINLNTADFPAAAAFYLALGFSQDPRQGVVHGGSREAGTAGGSADGDGKTYVHRTAWFDVGISQVHLPLSARGSGGAATNVIRGHVELLVPSLSELEARLDAANIAWQRVAAAAGAGEDKDKDKEAQIVVTCPQGNLWKVAEAPLSARDRRGFHPGKPSWGLAIPALEVHVRPGTAQGIASYFRHYFQAHVVHQADDTAARVRAGPHQEIRFVETPRQDAKVADADDADAQLPYHEAVRGYHICIYLEDHAGTMKRLARDNKLWGNPRFYSLDKGLGLTQFRCKDITWEGRTLAELEMEVRSLEHPGCPLSHPAPYEMPGRESGKLVPRLISEVTDAHEEDYAAMDAARRQRTVGFVPDPFDCGDEGEAQAGEAKKPAAAPAETPPATPVAPPPDRPPVPPSTAKPWFAVVAARLRSRDRTERDGIKRLIAEHSLLQSRNEQLEQRLVLAQHRSAAAAAAGGNGGNGGAGMMTAGGDAGTGAAHSSVQALKDQVAKLQSELMQTYRSEAQISSSALSASNQSQAARARLVQVEQALATATEASQALQARAAALEQSVAEKDASLSLYRRELQQLRKTLQESERKTGELAQDNQMMMARMVEDKQRLADELNLMNNLYERLRAQGGGGGGEGASKSGQGGGGSGGSVSVLPTQPKTWTKAHDLKIHAAVTGPHGSHLVTAGEDGVLKIWDVSRDLAAGARGTLRGSAAFVCVDWTGNYLVAGSSDRSATVFNVRTQKEHIKLSGHTGKVTACSFMGTSPRSIVTGSADASLKVWDTRQGYATSTIGCSSVCNTLDVAADGVTCVSGHQDGIVRVWDLRNGKSVHEIRGVHRMPLTSVRFAPSSSSSSSSGSGSRLLVTVSRDNNARLFSSLTWELQGAPLAHDDFAVGANNTQGALSADARYAACGGSSGTLFVWETGGDHAAPVRALQKHQSVVTACCWGKTGKRVMSVDTRGYLVVWE